jgi:hypothetical protein
MQEGMAQIISSSENRAARFEETMSGSLFSDSRDKTQVDKSLAKEEVDRIREIIKKPRLSREDLRELLYLLAASESKLVNYSDWERYIVLKYYIWCRDFVKCLEGFYDYTEELENKDRSGKFQLTDRTKKMFANCSHLMENNAKFLIDLYVNIARTSLSLGATAFLEVLRKSYDVRYSEGTQIGQKELEQKTGLFKRKGGTNV